MISHYWIVLIVSEFIFNSVCHCASNNLRIAIFYDSFLIPIIPLLMKTFKECYFVKSHLIESLIQQINPDLILEFRVERFLM